jgi:hypothetical protein
MDPGGIQLDSLDLHPYMRDCPLGLKNECQVFVIVVVYFEGNALHSEKNEYHSKT